MPSNSAAHRFPDPGGFLFLRRGVETLTELLDALAVDDADDRERACAGFGYGCGVMTDPANDTEDKGS